MLEAMSVLRGFVSTSGGQIHFRTAGNGKPVLLLHQTPRSSDEFRDVIPILSKSFQVFAIDTIGYGDSYKPRKDYSIEDYADAIIEFVNAQGIKEMSVVGHHTGAFIAIDLAAKHQEMVKKIVLSHALYFDESKREAMRKRPPIDSVEFKEDGSHLLELWNKRKRFYPKNNSDLLQRYVIDALKAGDKIEEGHRACASYHMEDTIGMIRCPTLLICGTEDKSAYPYQDELRSKIRNSVLKTIPGGMVPLPDQMPLEFSETIIPFLLS